MPGIPRIDRTTHARLDINAVLQELRGRAEEAKDQQSKTLERLDSIWRGAAAVLALERSVAAQAGELRDVQQALGEAHTQVIQERKLRLQHVPQPHVPLHQRHGCSAHTTAAGPTARPWQQVLREHTRYDDHDAGPQGSHDAQAALALRMQHEEQASQARQRIADLLQEGQQREARCQADAQSLHAQLQDAQQRLTSVQAETQLAIRDAITARQQQAQSEADAAVVIAQLEADRQDAAAAAKQERRQLLLEARQSRAAAGEAVTAAKKCRLACARQLAARDKEAVRLRAQTEDALHSSEQQLAEVRRRLTKALAGRQQLEARRALDVEGFVADTTLLRRALTATDRRLHEMRLADRLEHDERLEALLAGLRARPGAEVDATALEDIANIANRRQTFDDAEEALNKVADSLDAMQQRVAPEQGAAADEAE